MDSWEDSEPTAASSKYKFTDKWEGEDEEDDIKDNWDDEEEEAPTTATREPVKKLSTKQRILEKQAKKEAEQKARREELARITQAMTPEQRQAEKLRLQKIQQDSDLQHAVDMMGLGNADEVVNEVANIKEADLSNRAGLEAFGDAIKNKVKETEGLEKSLYYATYLETFFKDLCLEVGSDELKKIIASLNALYNDKVKSSKPAKGKKKNNPSSKATINAGKSTSTFEDDRFIDDLDDFL